MCRRTQGGPAGRRAIIPRMENMRNPLQSMSKLLSGCLSDALARLNVKILRGKELRRYEANRFAAHDLDFLRTVPSHCLAPALANLESSKAQLRQDLFALSVVGFDLPGYFVEFGAGDGEWLSNSWLLEKKFGWTGLLAEPAKIWHRKLAANRKCRVDTRCVWHSSGETIEFDEADTAELSTISKYAGKDIHNDIRNTTRRYAVETVSLADLLDQASAPRYIDYLSIDTEGSEFDILAGFDFDKYRFKVITCEHNYGKNRIPMIELLEGKGYKRRHPEISRFDDWFVDIKA